MATRNSLREIAKWMDDRSPVNSLYLLAKQHRWISIIGNSISFRKIVDRHKGGAESKEISFLFYNTWLIDGVVGLGSAPWLSIRANLIGEEIRNSAYDIAALCEVFDEEYRNVVKKLRFHYHAMGPDWTVGKTSSGLYTLSKFPLTSKRHRFVEKGGVPDNMSNKGTLLTTIDLGVGKIDLYTTHLFYGLSMSYPTPKNVQDVYQLKKTNIQLKQLRELTEFIKETHNPNHVVIVAGDMNINPGRSDINGRAYEQMKALFSSITLKNGSKISLEDLWNSKGGKKGGTNTPTKGCDPEKRYENLISGILYCSDETNETVNLDEGRYDCIFVQKPVASHGIIVDFSRMKRRPFPFPNLEFQEVKHLAVKPQFRNLFLNNNAEQIALEITALIKRECNGHLSDHLGVDVRLLVNKK